MIKEWIETENDAFEVEFEPKWAYCKYAGDYIEAVQWQNDMFTDAENEAIAQYVEENAEIVIEEMYEIEPTAEYLFCETF